MVTPRRQAVHARPAAIRAAVYAWLEDIKFRTGMLIGVGTLAIVGGAIAVAVVASGSSPSAHPPTVADRAPVIVPAASATPVASPGHQPSRARPAPASKPPADPPASQDGASESIPTTAPAPPPSSAPAGPGRAGWPHPGWRWPLPQHWPGPHGWPGPGGYQGRGPWPGQHGWHGWR